MSKKIQVIVAAFSIVALTIFFGCASFQEALIPCYIPPASMDYADANVPVFLPYTSLFDARLVNARMDYIHLLNQTVDRFEYEFLKGQMSFHIGVSQQFQETLFSPTGPVGLLFPAIFAGVPAALLIKRPGDKSKKEVEKEANNGSG